MCPHRRCCNVTHMTLTTFNENKRRGSLGWHLKEKTHCPQGHPYSGDNLLVSNGRRMCRTCRREKQHARRIREKQETCRAAGHERVPYTDSQGRDYCAVCRNEHNKKANQARWRAKQE